ncbi:MAG: hypothetical protein TUN42_02120 [Dehalogenimonas sp.]
MNQNTGATQQLNTEQPQSPASPHEAAPVHRKEGGQPGNQNARVHGFYSKYAATPRQEVMDEAAMLEGLDAEIVLLRSKIELLEELDPDNVKLFSELIRSLSLIMVRRKYSGAPALIAKVRKLAGALGAAAGAAGGVASVVQVIKK